jgi:DNA-binding NarL/FixJ family response regulator
VINHRRVCDSSHYNGGPAELSLSEDALISGAMPSAAGHGGGMENVAKKILCIEDDRAAAALLAQELTDRGFEVALAHSGQEGLLSIMRATPDLILCDFSMPIMTGFEVRERLNEIAPVLGRIPFIFLIAPGDRHNELRGRRSGADDYVTKPVDFERLVFLINARLAGVARAKPLPKHTNLNEREIEVLTLAARGKTSVEIARELRFSKRTVDFHIDNARTKLGAATRTEAVIKAARSGLIKP